MSSEMIELEHTRSGVGEIDDTSAQPLVFEEFFAATYEQVLRAMFMLTDDRSLAEDVAQEAFVRVFERWDKVATGPNPAGYVYRTALNLYRGRLRRLRLASRRVLSPATPDSLALVDERDALRRALQELPRSQREALILVFLVGMTHKEAGRILRVEPGTVRVRISRGLHALRSQDKATLHREE
jgi:RNA polymerase sigma-70 factor, ECF subfamily